MFATQTAPSPKAMPVGCRPTVIDRTDPASNVAGLNRWTVASPEFATQTAPLPTTSPAGATPANDDPTTRASTGSIRANVESPNTAQTEPSPTAVLPVRELGAATSTVFVTRLNCSSTRETCPRIPCATHTAPAPTATPVGVRSPSVTVSTYGALHGIDPGQRSVVEIADPDRAVTCCDRPGSDAHRDLVNDRVRARIDDADRVRADTRQAVLRVTAKKDSGADDGDERGRSRGQDHRSPPPGPAQSRLGGLCEVSVTADRRKRVGQAACVCLIEADRPVEVLEPLLAEVSQEDVEILLLVLEQGLRRLRHEDLPAVPRCTDPCCAVHREPGVTAVAARPPARCGDPSAP